MFIGIALAVFLGLSVGLAVYFLRRTASTSTSYARMDRTPFTYGESGPNDIELETIERPPLDNVFGAAGDSR